jgi:hypothetical protein
MSVVVDRLQFFAFLNDLGGSKADRPGRMSERISHPSDYLRPDLNSALEKVE